MQNKNKNNEKQDVNKMTTELEKATKEQFDHLSIVTLTELTQEEQPFLHISTSDDTNFRYEITLTINSPNLFLFVDDNGGFRVEGHSSWCSTVKMDGHNEELLSYINTISTIGV
jgi:hypothetical protein